MDFTNKVVLITGGSAGLGFATARLFLEENAKVMITSRSSEKLEAARKELNSISQEIHTVVCDVSNENDVRNLFNQVEARFGRIDILVNNAGIALVSKLTDTSIEEWNRIMSVNSTGTFLLCREAVKIMSREKIQGRIINISSITGKTGAAMATAYTASKAAVIGFTKALAKEIASLKINVNCICPGAMETGMFYKDTIGAVAKMYKMDEKPLIDSTISSIPLKRLINPLEIASLILFLASDKGACVTGVAWDAACGMEIH
jgi:NAD(P)-dependent dehydrogenase (short-subunit alcohol dehydrogenase family)